MHHTTTFIISVVEHWLERDIVPERKCIQLFIGTNRKQCSKRPLKTTSENNLNHCFLSKKEERKEGNVLFTVIWRRTYGKGPLR